PPQAARAGYSLSGIGARLRSLLELALSARVSRSRWIGDRGIVGTWADVHCRDRSCRLAGKAGRNIPVQRRRRNSSRLSIELPDCFTTSGRQGVALAVRRGGISIVSVSSLPFHDSEEPALAGEKEAADRSARGAGAHWRSGS